MRTHSLPVLTLLLTSSLLWLATPAVAASFKLEATGGEPLYRSEVPLAVYQSTRQDRLGDITIRNAANERVPHVLLEKALLLPPVPATDSILKLPLFPLASDALQHTTISGAQASTTEQLRIALEKNANNTTVSISQGAANSATSRLYLLDAGDKHAPINKLTLDWTQTDANMMAMEVLASDDLIRWSTVGQGVLLKTVNDAGAILQNSITLDSPSSARYLQLRSSQNAQAFTLTSAEAHVSNAVNEPASLLWQALAHGKRRDDANSGLSTIEFEADGRYPAELLRIQLAENNTIATVRVAVRNTLDEPWRSITAASLYRMTQRGANSQGNSQGNTLTNPDISIYPTVARYWQLQFNQATGSIGAGSPGLALGWPVQTLVWNARGSRPFSLQTGATTNVNHVTIASLIPDFKPEKLKQLPLAVISLNNPTSTMPTIAANSWSAQPAPQAKQRWWLWGGLVLGVLMLAGMAVSLLKSTALRSTTFSSTTLSSTTQESSTATKEPSASDNSKPPGGRDS